jgi:hypothetical protein
MQDGANLGRFGLVSSLVAAAASVVCFSPPANADDDLYSPPAHRGRRNRRHSGNIVWWKLRLKAS